MIGIIVLLSVYFLSNVMSTINEGNSEAFGNL